MSFHETGASLTTLYYETGGPNWFQQENWCTNMSYCDWCVLCRLPDDKPDYDVVFWVGTAYFAVVSMKLLSYYCPKTICKMSYPTYFRI